MTVVSRSGVNDVRQDVPPRRRRVGVIPVAVGGLILVPVVVLAIGNSSRESGAVDSVIATPAAARSASPGTLPARSAASSPTTVGRADPTGSAATPAAGSPPVASVGAATVTGAWFRGWSDRTAVTRGQVLAVVDNATRDWVTVPGGASHYTITDGAGRVAASGAFAYAFPQRVAPGGRAYLVDIIDASFADLAALVDVTVEPVVAPGEAAGDAIMVTDVTWTAADDGGLTASGRLTNPGDSEAGAVVVAVVFLDAEREPLAVLYEPQPIRLAPNETAQFTTSYPDTGPVDPKVVATTEPIAAPYEP